MLLYRKALSATADTWCEVSSDLAGDTVVVWGSTIAPAPLLATATAHRYTSGSDTYQLITFAPATAVGGVAYLSPSDKFSITGFTMSDCAVTSSNIVTTEVASGVTTVTKATRDPVQIRCRDTSASYSPATMKFSATANGVTGTVTRGDAATAHTLSFSPTSEYIYRASPAWFPAAKPVDVTFFSGSLTLRCSSQIAAVAFINAAGAYLSTTTLSSWTGSAAPYTHTITVPPSTAGLLPLYRNDSSSNTLSCAMSFADGNDFYVMGDIAQAPMIGAATTVHYASTTITVAATAQGSVTFWSAFDVLSVTGVTVSSCTPGANTAASVIDGVATLRPLNDMVLATSLTMTCTVSGAYTRSAVAVSWTVSGIAYPVTPTVSVTAPALTLESTMSPTWLPFTDSVLNSVDRFDVSADVDPQFATDAALVLKCTRALELAVSFSSTALLSKDFLSVTGSAPLTQTVPLAIGATLLALLHRVSSDATTTDCTIETVSGVKVYALFTVAPRAVSNITAALLRQVPATGSQKFEISIVSSLFLSLADFITVSASGATLGSCVLATADVTAGKTVTHTSNSNGTLSLQVTGAVQTAFTVLCDISESNYVFNPANIAVAVVTNGQPAASLLKDGSVASYPALTFTAASEVKLLPQTVGLSSRAIALEGSFDSVELVLECSVPVEAVAFTTETAVVGVSTMSPSGWTDVNSEGVLYRRSIGLVSDAGLVLLYRGDTTSSFTCTFKEGVNGTVVYSLATFAQTPLADVDVSFLRSSAGVTIAVTPAGAAPFTSARDVFSIAGLGITSCTATDAAVVTVASSGAAFSRAAKADSGATLSVHCESSDLSSTALTKLQLTASGAAIERALGDALTDGITFTDKTPAALPLAFAAGPSALVGVQFASLMQGQTALATGQTTLVCDSSAIEEVLLLQSTDSKWTRTMMTLPWTVTGSTHAYMLPEITAAHSGIALLYRAATETPLAKCALQAPNKFIFTAMTTVPVVTHTPVLSVLVARVGTETTVTVKSRETTLSFISRNDMFSLRNIDAASCASADQSANGFALGDPAFTAEQSNALVLAVQCTAASADSDYNDLVFVTRFNGVEQTYAAGVMGVPVRVLVDDNVTPVTFNKLSSGAKAFPLTARFQTGSAMLVCDTPAPMIGLVSSTGATTPVALASWEQTTQIDNLYYHSFTTEGATGLVMATRQARTCTVYDSHGATPYTSTRVPVLPLELDATVMPTRYTVSVTFAPIGAFALLEAEDTFTLSSHVHNCVAVTNAVVASGNKVSLQTGGFQPVAPSVVCNFVTSYKRLFDMTLTTTVAGVNTTYPLSLTSTPPVSFRSLTDSPPQPCAENADCLSGVCLADGTCGKVSGAAALSFSASAMLITLLAMSLFLM